MKEKQAALKTTTESYNQVHKQYITNQEEIANLEKALAIANKKIPSAKKEYEEAKALFLSIKDNYEKRRRLLVNLTHALEKAQGELVKLSEKLEQGRSLYEAAEAARNRYFDAKERIERLQASIGEYRKKAEFYKTQIPLVKERVLAATKAVVAAREAYDASRKRLYEASSSVRSATEDVVIVGDKDGKKQVDPLKLEVDNAVKRLREEELQMREVYKQADYFAFMVKKSERELASLKKNIGKLKLEYEKAVKALEPWGTLDPIAPKGQNGNMVKEEKKVKAEK